MKPNMKAHRLRAYIKKTLGHSVLAMPRDDWNVLKVNSTNLVKIDVECTPLSNVAQKSCILAAVAQESSVSDARVSIYRHDEKDQPTPVNVDRYLVWLDLANHQRIHKMVQAASTSLDENLRQYLEENVFLLREQPGDDHWLSKLPDSVEVLINVSSTSI